MHPKVLNHLVDRLQAIDLISLDVKARKQIAFGQMRKNFRGPLHRRAKLPDERGCGKATACLKFGGSVPRVLIFPEGADQPLPHVAIEVQDQIPNAVAGLIGHMVLGVGVGVS